MAWHARLSASQTKDWAHCAGTIALKEFFPVFDPSGDAARLGTCAHALIERCLEEGVPPSSYEGQLIEIVKPDTDDEDVKFLHRNAKMPPPSRIVYEVDVDMIDATTAFVDYVLERLAALFPETYDPETDTADRYAWSKTAVAKGTVKLEGWVNPLPERDDTGGTADVTIDAWPELLEVVDYKNGVGVLVPVWSNWQLRSYTLGRAVEASPELDEYESYRYTIGQPRHHMAPEGGMSWEDISPAELRTFRKTLQDAVKRVDRARECGANYMANCEKAGEEGTVEGMHEALYAAGFLTTEPDGNHCTWCNHLNDCPAARARVTETIGMDFDDDPEELEPPLGANHLAVVLPWAAFIKKFLKAAEDKAEEILLAGGEVPGYKIIRKSGNRTWKEGLEDDAVIKRLASEYGVAPEKLVTPPTPGKLRTGPQVEKLVPSKRKKDFEAEFLYKPVGGFSMVPESNPGRAVRPDTAADDFDDVED